MPSSPVGRPDHGMAVENAEILDCTLRDGSYAVDFQFTAGTITNVLTGLEAAGIGWIELGHGLGLNAESTGKPPLVSDRQCFEIASATLTTARWGMFCIPGIASTDHLRRAADAGMHFVRVGVNITEVEPAEEFLRIAHDLGLVSFLNLMKTNVLGSADVAKTVAWCADQGAGIVYLVDSVGGYLPAEVSELFDHVRGVVDVPLGFHGHDNLGLANANALAAACSGACYVDTTLDGIGRGAGNAVTEMFSAILRARTENSRSDYLMLSRLSDAEIRPLPRLPEDRTFQVAGGLTQTHSSFFPLIGRYAREHNVDGFDLMAAVADINRVNPTEELIKSVASALMPS